MASKRITKAYAKLLAEHLHTLATAAISGVVFVQFTPGQHGDIGLVMLGLIAFWLLHILAYLLIHRIGGDE